MKKNYAGVGVRFLSLLVDAIIFALVGYVLRSINLNDGINTVLMFGYTIFMLGKYGQTVGMMALKIKAVKESGKEVTYMDAFIRGLMAYVSGFVFLLGYLWAIWDPKKQTWHDKIAKTLIVNVK